MGPEWLAPGQLSHGIANPLKGEAMFKIGVLLVYLTHLIISGSLQLKTGGGLDPLGKPTPPPPPSAVDAGGGLDPFG